MSARPDLVGQTFGRLVVKESVRKHGGKPAWLCGCECGGSKIVTTALLRAGITRSCGCLFVDAVRASNTRHGMSRTTAPKAPEYRIWSLAIQRCHNPHHPPFKNYGGRGITVCDRWRASFEAFYADMGPRPSPAYSLDRIDNDKGYCPENCRWATRTEQARNSRKARLLTWNGETRCVSEWAAITGIRSNTIRARIDDCGWSVDLALSTPV
jgi:hypothetical protein